MTADSPLSELEQQFLTFFHSVLGFKSLTHRALPENHSEMQTERPGSFFAGRKIVLSDESEVTAQIGAHYIAHQHAELSLAPE